MKLIIILLSLILSTNLLASEHQVFILEKSFNPENIMVFNVHLDAKCQVVFDPAKGHAPKMNIYWLNDRKHYEALTSMYINSLNKTLSIRQDSANHFHIEALDLGKISHDLPKPVVEVESRRNSKGECEVKGEIQLGAKDQSKVMILHTVYTVIKTRFGIPVGSKEIHLIGTDKMNGTALTARYFEN